MAVTDYDQFWKGMWGEMQNCGPVHRHSARVITDLLRPLNISSIVDVGCGNGANLVAIHRALGIEKIAGYDVSASALDVAQKRLPHATFSLADFEVDNLSDRYDAVLSSQVIEHLHDDALFLRKLRDLCRSWCIVATVQGKMRPSEVRIGHLRNYHRGELEAKMRDAGFEVVTTVEWGWPFYSPIYRSAIEVIGGQTADLSYGRRDRAVASLLYQLYRLNSHRRGDVLTVLARAV